MQAASAYMVYAMTQIRYCHLRKPPMQITANCTLSITAAADTPIVAMLRGRSMPTTGVSAAAAMDRVQSAVSCTGCPRNWPERHCAMA